MVQKVLVQLSFFSTFAEPSQIRSTCKTFGHFLAFGGEIERFKLHI
jgi:hypothetical protein